MSAIPPQLPPTRPVATVPTPASRADFFKAALANVQASATFNAQPAPAPSRAVPSTAPPEDRPTRPGALLDIRV